MKRLLVVLVALAGARAARGGRRAPARQLHGQPLHARSSSRATGLRALRARPGGDPDLPGRRRAFARLGIRASAIARDLELRLDGQPVALRVLDDGVARPVRAQAGLETLRFDARLRGRARWPAGAPVSLTFRDGNFAGRLGWREVVVRADARRAARTLDRPGASRERRAARLPGRPAPSPARRRLGAGDFAPGRARARRPRSAGAARRASEPAGGFAALVDREDLSARRRARLAPRRAVLGRGARAHPGPRQGDRRGLHGRHARDGRATRSCSAGS